MRKSAVHLRELYDRFADHQRSWEQVQRSKYPEKIALNEPQTPRVDSWLLCQSIPRDMLLEGGRTSKETPRVAPSFISMFSIYGGITDLVEGKEPGDVFVKFENDEQAEDVMRAGERLNVRQNPIRCYRIRTLPWQ